MEPSACTWCGIAQRPHGRQFADAAGWHAWAQPSQEQMLARMKARRLALTVAREGALPVPVGPEPRTLDVVEDELTGVSLSLYEEELTSERLRWALASAKRGRARLRARVAELEAATDGCSCPPADHPHQVGCPLDSVPEALTQSFAPAAAPHEDVSRQVEKLRNLLAGQRAAVEDPHDSPLHHNYRVPHDLPPTGGAL
jgi:hypothetical protein